MTQHTPEPWVCGFPNVNGEQFSEADCQISKDGSLIANVSHGPIFPVEPFGSAAREANARRIVACVNACAEIPTDDLEDTKLLPMLDPYGIAIQQRDNLQAQVDELQAALVSTKSALERCYDVTDWPCNGNTDQDKAIAIATAAINKITGEPK